jgi:hypothetical protein
METKEITMLRQEIAELRARIDDLVKAQNIDREHFISANKDTYQSCYQYIADIHDYLWPLIHKVFPQYAEGQKQIDAFMKGRRPIDGEEKRP